MQWSACRGLRFSYYVIPPEMVDESFYKLDECTANMVTLFTKTYVDPDFKKPSKDDHDWKSTTVLIQKLVDIVSKGGNFLLNVGPKPDGTIPEPSVDRLLAIGEWLQVNGEAVYGTQAGPIQGESWCRSTTKGDQLYLHIFEWPSNGKIEISLPGLNVTSATLLGDPLGAALPVTSNAGQVVVVGPKSAPDASDTVVVLLTEQV